MRRKRIIKSVTVFLAVTIVISAICTCFFTARGVFVGSMQLVDNQMTSLGQGRKMLESAGFDMDVFQHKYTIETVELPSTDGSHTIPASHITIDGRRDRNTVVMVHGLGGNRVSVYPIAEKLLENGYNVIAYDQRSSGENKAPYTTYGYLESYDLEDYICYADSIVGKDKKLVLWGTSFGGATVGIAMGNSRVQNRVAGAVLDCPLSNMSDMLENTMGKMEAKLPVGFMLSMGNIATKIKLGFFYADTDVCRYVSQSDIPLLVINSRADGITPYYMGKTIFEAAKTPRKEIYTIDDSEHAKIFRDHPCEYVGRMVQFIQSL